SSIPFSPYPLPYRLFLFSFRSCALRLKVWFLLITQPFGLAPVAGDAHLPPVPGKSGRLPHNERGTLLNPTPEASDTTGNRGKSEKAVKGKETIFSITQRKCEKNRKSQYGDG
ncbi:MAG: hypothetical protein P8X85_06010, partial [Desulfobacterales bacterium]